MLLHIVMLHTYIHTYIVHTYIPIQGVDVRFTEGKILATAHSNVATDNMMEKLIKLGLKVCLYIYIYIYM